MREPRVRFIYNVRMDEDNETVLIIDGNGTELDDHLPFPIDKPLEDIDWFETTLARA